MKDFIKNMIYKGVGLASLSKNKIEDMVKEISEATELSEEEGKRLVKEFMEESRKAKQDMERQVNSAVQKVIEKMNVPSKKEIESLKSRLDKLEKKLSAKNTST